MPIYVDCEFNGFGGATISLALVSTKGEEWYEVLQLPPPAIEPIVPWVAANVIPILGKLPIPRRAFEERLHNFLLRHEGETIIADHWADFERLISCLHGEGGLQLACDLNLQWIRRDSPYNSALEHNALSDALALMHWHQLKLAEKAA